jgi:hypothetical protein
VKQESRHFSDERFNIDILKIRIREVFLVLIYYSKGDDTIDD